MTKFEKYAYLAIKKGINLQKGQKLFIRSSVDNTEFVRNLAEIAWKNGAKDVMVQWSDEKLSRLRFLHGDDDILGNKSEWQTEYMKQVVDEDYQMLAVISNNPENYKGIDPKRMSKELAVVSKTVKPLTDKTITNTVQWSVISLPSPEWAIKVFPNAKNTEEAIEKMWEAIFCINRIDDNDLIENWNKHIEVLASQSKKLNDYKLKSLIYKNSIGTNLEIGLPKGHKWVGGSKQAKTGNMFIANIPTEEIFTTPHKDEVNGIVYSTKPLIYMGNIIDDFWIKFEKGRATAYKANIGHEFLEKMITAHPNADFLGEVALVPQSSPISKLGIVWYNVLYDENASCHLALGNAYSYTVEDTEGLSEDELMAKGINRCLSHNDFMIGSDCMNIVGKTEDGREIDIFQNGEWAI